MEEVLKLFKEKNIKGLIKYYENNKKVKPLDIKELVPKIFKTIKEYEKFMHEFTIKYSTERIKKSLNEDDLISVYVNYLDSIDDIINNLFERVFEHYTLYNPEHSIKVQELKEFTGSEIKKETLMGMEFEKIDREL
jgi:RNA processing factor Prp31